MMIQSDDHLQTNSIENPGDHRPTQGNACGSSSGDFLEQAQTRIKIRIPKALHEEPVISRLVSHHGVTVNITAALLGANARDDGWFDLELRGTTPQIHSALTYLDELNLEIWGQSTAEEDGW